MKIFKHWKAMLTIAIGSALAGHVGLWIMNLSPPYIPAWTGILITVIECTVVGSVYYCMKIDDT